MLVQMQRNLKSNIERRIVMYKIEAVVKFNKSEALVLSEHPKILYERYGNYLFGLDEYGVFCNCYKYDSPSKGWEAFAGRKFDIPITDGTFEHAYGQWWDGGADEFAKALGSEIISVTVRTKDDLKRCYVFTGCRADKAEYSKLRGQYQGKVFDYWEYEKLLKKEVI